MGMESIPKLWLGYLRSMTLDDLRVFVAVCRAGSLSAVARELGVDALVEDVGVVVEVARGVEVGPWCADRAGRVAQEVQPRLLA